MKRQADGRYKSAVVVGHRADGTPIKKFIYGSTKRELEEMRQEVLRKYRDGESLANTSLLAVDWLYQYFDTVVAPRQKPQTAHDIRAQLKKYVEPLLADKQLRAVTFIDLQEIVNGLAGKGRTLTGNISSVLRRAFGAAHSQGLIPRDPSASLLTRLPPRRANRAFTDEEILILEKNLAERRTEPLMIGLFYYTGMRRGEAIGLQWRDVDFKREVIRVRRDYDYKTNSVDTLKTANAERDIPMAPALRDILQEHRGIGKAYVLCSPTSPMKPLCEATLKRRWKKVQELLGSDVTTRTFRNNFATVLYDAGVDVLTAAKVMGHADPTTTLKIYTDLQRSRRVKAGNDAVKFAFPNNKLGKN